MAPTGDYPEIKSKSSLVAKHVTEPIYAKLKDLKTKTSGFTLDKAIACAVQFDNQHCGIYAGDWDSYKVNFTRKVFKCHSFHRFCFQDFSPVFDPLIQEYHGITSDSKHTSDMDVTKIKGNIDSAAPVHSTRIRVGRSIDGFGLSPGITKEQRLGVENLMKKAFANLKEDLAGTYFPLTGMNEEVRQQLVDDHFLFVSGDPNLKVAGMERDWPEGRGIYHNKDKTFLTWVNEEDQLRIISMQKGGDVKGVFDRLARGIKAVGDSVKAESGKDFMLDEKVTNAAERSGFISFLAVRLCSLLPHQPRNGDARLRPHRPAGLDQAGAEGAGGPLRGAAPAAARHQGGVRGPDRRHLRHLEQAQTRLQ